MAAWFDLDWEFRKEITIDPTKVPSNQTDFPVLISVTDTDISAEAQIDGDDILFTDSDGVTQLKHEIEKYVTGTGELIAWVKVPTVSGSVDTVIFVYYGNPTVGPQEDPANVWDADYVGVWHLKEDPSGGAPQMKDSTSNGNDGTSGGGMTLGDLVAAQIGDGIDYDGSDDEINCGSDASLDNVAALTAEAWIQPETGIDTLPRIFEKRGAGEVKLWYKNGAGAVALVFVHQTTATSLRRDTTDTVPLSAFTHAVVTWDGSLNASGVLHYLNGALAAMTAGTNGTGTLEDDAAGDLWIGNRHNATRTWTGILDEFRLSKIVRSADYITTTFNNHDSPGTFYAVGAEETFIAVAVGQASETNVAQAITPKTDIVVPVGQSTETNVAQVITPTFVTTIPFGQASETNLAQKMFFPVTIADAGLVFIRILTTEVANVVPVEFVTVFEPGVVRVREAFGTLTPIQNVVPVRETLETPRVKLIIA